MPRHEQPPLNTKDLRLSPTQVTLLVLAVKQTGRYELSYAPVCHIGRAVDALINKGLVSPMAGRDLLTPLGTRVRARLRLRAGATL